MIRLWNCTDRIKNMIEMCEELPKFRFLDYEEMEILLCYNETMLEILQQNIKKLNKELSDDRYKG